MNWKNGKIKKLLGYINLISGKSIKKKEGIKRKSEWISNLNDLCFILDFLEVHGYIEPLTKDPPFFIDGKQIKLSTIRKTIKKIHNSGGVSESMKKAIYEYNNKANDK